MKKMISILMALALFCSMMSVTFAYSIGGEISPTAPGGSGTFAATILGYMQWVGYAIAIGMLIYVGIKYIMASANDKAEIKNALLKYVLGAILIAAASTIAGWIFTAGASLK